MQLIVVYVHVAGPMGCTQHLIKLVAPPFADNAANVTSPRQYPTQSCRIVVDNQPYGNYAPRMQFLQLGKVQAHRNALVAAKEQGLHLIGVNMALMHATTTSDLNVDDAVHQVDLELGMTSKHKMAVWRYLMTQYNLKPSLSKFGKCEIKVAAPELTQLHVLDAWMVVDPTKLTRDNRAMALSPLLFLKEKWYRKIKSRACIKQVPQQAYILKEEAASSNVSTDLIFISPTIAASKKRHIWCYDVPSTFVNSNINENVLMVLKGELVEMMVSIALQIYHKHITVDKKGTPVLHMKLQKALYGLMRVSLLLLFYRKLRKELEDLGFVVDLYDPFVWQTKTWEMEIN